MINVGSPKKKIKLSQVVAKAKKSRALLSSTRFQTVKELPYEDQDARAFLVSEFQTDQNHQSESEKSEQVSFEEFQQMRLVRKNTNIEPSRDNIMDQITDLQLYRNSSTIEVARHNEDIKFGDNIYIQQITQHSEQPKPHRRDYKSTRQQMHSRFENDYFIESEPVSRGNHLSYVCMNKLERICHSVIQMRFNQADPTQTSNFLQFHTSDQIRIYNKDVDNHFLRFYHSWVEDEAIFLAFEVAASSLRDTTESSKHLKEGQIWDLLKDCASGLQWLKHKQNEHHLNITPDNILKCKNKYKLTDPLGQRNVCSFMSEEHIKDLLYVAPEIRRFHKYLDGLDLSKSDIYSLGMCVIEHLAGLRTAQMSYSKMKYRVQRYLKGYSPALMRLLLKMVKADPYLRPAAEELCDTYWENKRGKPRRRYSI